MIMVTMLVSAILFTKTQEIRKDKINFDKVKAGYIAEAGIENLAWYLRAYQSPTWEWGDPEYTGVITVDGSASATGKVWATKVNGNYLNGLYYNMKLSSNGMVRTIKIIHILYNKHYIIKV